MEKELENKLYEKYPKLFRQKDLSMQETCLCWGLECGAGWYWLIDNLCNCIQGYIDANDKSQVEFVQIKEKFGMLRAYIDNADEYTYGMISLAASLSYKTCEMCGSTTDIMHTKGWIKTICTDCQNKKKAKSC